MSRDFESGNSEYFVNSSPPVTAAAFSLSLWVNPETDSGSNLDVLTISNTSTANNYFRIQQRTDSVVRFAARDTSGGQSDLDSSATVSAGTWTHIGAAARAANDRELWINGSSEGTNTTSETPTGIDSIQIGCQDNASGPVNYYDGQIAHVAIWNVGLTDAEFASLAAGASPLSIRPGSLVFYAPLSQASGNEFDIVGGLTLTDNGTVGAGTSNPATFSPTGHQYTIPAAGGGGGDGSYSNLAVASNGEQITFTLAGMDHSAITGFEAGKSVTITGTSEGYTNGVLGTRARSLTAYFNSVADNGSDVDVTLDLSEPIHDDCTSIAITADAGLFDDGSVTSAALSGESVTNNSTLDYPVVAVCRHSTIRDRYTGTFDIVVAAAGPAYNGHLADFGIDRVTIELDDGTNQQTLTATRQAVARLGDYGPSENVMLYSAEFDADDKGDGNPFATKLDGATWTATAYPKVGDADSLRTCTGTVALDATDSATIQYAYVDSRGTFSLSTGLSGAVEEGWKVVGDTSGAVGVVHADASSGATTLQVDFYSNGDGASDWSSGEDLTITDNTTPDTTVTATLSGVPSWNGSDAGTVSTTAATAKADPFREICRAANDIWVANGSASDDGDFQEILLEDGHHAGGQRSTNSLHECRNTYGWLYIKRSEDATSVDTVKIIDSATSNGFHYGFVSLEGVTIVKLPIFSGNSIIKASGNVYGPEATTTGRYIDCKMSGGAKNSYTGELNINSPDGWTGVRDARNCLYTNFKNATGFRWVDSQINDGAGDCLGDADDLMHCNVTVSGWDRDTELFHGDMLQLPATAAPTGNVSNMILYHVAITDHDMQHTAFTGGNATPPVFQSFAELECLWGWNDGGQNGQLDSCTIDSWFRYGVTSERINHGQDNGGETTTTNVFVRHCVYNNFTVTSTGGEPVVAGFVDNHFISGLPHSDGDGTTGGTTSSLFTNFANHDYSPQSGTDLVDRVASGDRMNEYDLYGFTRLNDGTGAVGAVELGSGPPSGGGSGGTWAIVGAGILG